MTDIAQILAAPSLDVAPALLGAVIEGRGVRVRLTEVEAYMGAEDPGSHGFRGLRERNRHLFGPAGRLYAYRSYGIHTCVNVVCGADGVSSGVLLRAGAVIDGIDIARERRGAVRDSALARGPGNFGTAIGARLDTDAGTDLLHGEGPYRLTLDPLVVAAMQGSGVASAREALVRFLESASAGQSPRISRGPRTGIRGLAGGARYPWRFWLTGDPTVSSYRRHPAAIDTDPAAIDADRIATGTDPHAIDADRKPIGLDPARSEQGAVSSPE